MAYMVDIRLGPKKFVPGNEEDFPLAHHALESDMIAGGKENAGAHSYLRIIDISGSHSPSVETDGEAYPHPAFAEIAESGLESVLWRTPLEKSWMYRGMGTKALRKLARYGAKARHALYGSGKVPQIKAQGSMPFHWDIETMHRYAGLEKFLESQLPPMQASEMTGLGTCEYQQGLDAYLCGVQDAGIDAIIETVLPQPKLRK